jgi:hypothetical protein
MQMEKSPTKPTPDSKTTDPVDPEMRKRLNDFHKKIGQALVDALNRNVVDSEAEHRKGK